jgi:putative phage-type endonuclease
MRIVELAQQTDDWLSWRQLGIGASDAAAIMGVDRFRSRSQIIDSKIRLMAKIQENRNTVWGHENEYRAVSRYYKRRGILTRPVCVIHDTVPWLRASLDGLSMDNQTILEVKCINQHLHEQALRGRVPECYRPQVQHQLMIAVWDAGAVGFIPNAADYRAHYVSFNKAGRWTEVEQLAVVEVKPDLDYCRELFAAEQAAWAECEGALTARPANVERRSG